VRSTSKAYDTRGRTQATLLWLCGVADSRVSDGRAQERAECPLPLRRRLPGRAGSTKSSMMASAFSRGAILQAFDLIELDGNDLRRAIEYRKRMLAKVMRDHHSGILCFSAPASSAAKASYRSDSARCIARVELSRANARRKWIGATSDGIAVGRSKHSELLTMSLVAKPLTMILAIVIIVAIVLLLQIAFR